MSSQSWPGLPAESPAPHYSRHQSPAPPKPGPRTRRGIPELQPTGRQTTGDATSYRHPKQRTPKTPLHIPKPEPGETGPRSRTRSEFTKQLPSLRTHEQDEYTTRTKAKPTRYPLSPRILLSLNTAAGMLTSSPLPGELTTDHLPSLALGVTQRQKCPAGRQSRLSSSSSTREPHSRPTDSQRPAQERRRAGSAANCGGQTG